MCVNKHRIRNPKYKANQKNGGVWDDPKDARLKGIEIPCGYCIECRKAKAREWAIRVSEEIKHSTKKGYFVTLSFSEGAMDKLVETTGIDEANIVATKAVEFARKRQFKRWQKGKSCEKSFKHWFITELGHNCTERLHIHGIVWTNDIKAFKRDWEKHYGNTYIGEYCNAKTANYCTKYMLKLDQDHKGYKGKTMVSPGLGAGYLTQAKRREHKFKGEETITYYRNEAGFTMGLPTYYQRKLWDDDEREELRIINFNKPTVWVGKKEFTKGDVKYITAWEQAIRESEKLGFKYEKKRPWRTRNGGIYRDDRDYRNEAREAAIKTTHDWKWESYGYDTRWEHNSTHNIGWEVYRNRDSWNDEVDKMRERERDTRRSKVKNSSKAKPIDTQMKLEGVDVCTILPRGTGPVLRKGVMKNTNERVKEFREREAAAEEWIQKVKERNARESLLWAKSAGTNDMNESTTR